LRNDRPNIIFTEGHDELKKEETADLEQNLRAFYNTGRINLDSITTIPFKDSASKVDVLVVAKPKTGFSEKQKFQLDQYVMQGGRVIWLIDRLNADLAGMQQSGEMMPTDYPLNLEDLLYKYGIRIVNSMVVDMEAARIPMKVGQVGNQPQMELFQWYYYPIVAPTSKHPIVRSLDRVWFQFPSSIDTIRTKSAVKKSVILTSSKHARLQMTPTKLSFEILRYPTDPTKFDKADVPLAVMLEGQFTSLFENRVTPEQVAVLQKLGQQFTPLSKETKMLVVADGDIARNEYDVRQGQMLPLGYNRFENYKFANKDFLLNAVEYMLDDKGIIEARGKEVKLRLMDTQKAKDNTVLIRALNIVLPLLFLGLFGFGFTWFRKRKYAY
jgi:ABC-2 type transport system permease protein